MESIPSLIDDLSFNVINLSKDIIKEVSDIENYMAKYNKNL